MIIIFNNKKIKMKGMKLKKKLKKNLKQRKTNKNKEDYN
jgi:hypothetical protein